MSSHNATARGGGVIQYTVQDPDKSDDIFNAELASEAVKRTDKLNDTTIEMAVRLKQAREFMAWSASHLRGLWLDWQDEASQANRHMNEFRMAFDRESKAVMATAKDVTAFFNSPEYTNALAKLKETTDLLEKFAELKRNGALDTLADFILKVTCPNP